LGVAAHAGRRVAALVKVGPEGIVAAYFMTTSVEFMPIS
jgi:hypothetical protein